MRDERTLRRRKLRSLSVLLAIAGLLTLSLSSAMAHSAKIGGGGSSGPAFAPDFTLRAEAADAADVEGVDEDATEDGDTEGVDEDDQGEDEDAQGDDGDDQGQDANEDDGDQGEADDADDDQDQADEDDGGGGDEDKSDDGEEGDD
jgi:hypothetical protein